MKKIFIILTIILFQLQTFAFEDYVISSEKSMDNIYSKNENIVSVLPIYTIDNPKNTAILKAKREGKTLINIETDDATIPIEVTVYKNKTVLSSCEDILFFPLDTINEEIKPVLREAK